MTLPSKYLVRSLPWTIPGAALLLLAGLVLLRLQSHTPLLSLGITVDLLITIPLIHLGLMRRQRASGITALSWFVIGVVVASLVLPSTDQHYLTLAKTWVVPLVELSLLSFVLYRVRQISVRYRRQQYANDFYTNLLAATTGILPATVAKVLTTEVATLYYGFFVWKPYRFREHEFSYHRRSGSVALWATILFLALAETAVVHILLVRWSTVAAWILTGISVYTAFQIWGIIRSMYHRPIAVDQGGLRLRYGYIGEVTVPWAEVASAVPAPAETSVPRLSPLGALEPANVLIRFCSPQTVLGLYGSRRKVTSLALYADEPQRLIERLRLNIVASGQE